MYFFNIRPHYTWVEDEKTEHQNKEWIILSEQKSTSIFSPWTIFYPYPSYLTVAKKIDLGRPHSTVNDL